MGLDAPTIGVIAAGYNESNPAAHLWIKEQARDHFYQLRPNKVIVRFYSKCERLCVEEALALDIPTQLIMPQTREIKPSEEKIISRCNLWAPAPNTPIEAATILVTLADILIIISKQEHTNTYLKHAKRLGCDLIWISY